MSWSKKLTKSTENCYSIQEARVVDRSKGRYISPIRVKNKNIPPRSTSPSAQSVSSIRTTISSTSTPTHFTLNRLQHRIKTANVFDCDKEHDYSEADNGDAVKLSGSVSVIEGTFQSYRSELSRTIGGYSVPYREKRNPLSNTRLSCYKPVINTPITSDSLIGFNHRHLKNYKSVEDFLSMDATESSSSSDTASCNRINDEFNDDASLGLQKSKRLGLSSKFRSMSNKTQKLFSKLYSSSNSLKSSTAEVSNDFTINIQPKKLPLTSSKVSHSRRSLSYGMLPDLKDNFEVKKIETEDGDSGILVNESGASSMIETEQEEKSIKEAESLENKIEKEKFIQR